MNPACRLAAVALALVGLEGTARPQDVDLTIPPYSGAYEPQGVDERGLWMEVDEAERQFRDSTHVLKDERLTQWLGEVLCRTVGDDRCASARIYVVRDASFNAAMAPNGLMLVHTGLLARLTSESELATILGHEFAHFERRHTLNQFKKIRASTDLMAWFGLAGAAARVDMTSVQNSLIAGIFSYSREQEMEADKLGAAYAKASPYRLNASAVWKRVIEEDNARREARGLRKRRHKYSGWLDSHPAEAERQEYLAELEAKVGDEGDPGVEAYREAIAPVLPMLLDELLRRNDFGGVDYILRSRGELAGWSGPLLYAQGELYRQRGNPRDLVTAREFFTQSMNYPDAPAESWRGLGLCAIRLGDREAGREALAEYIRRAPDAQDVGMMKLLVEGTGDQTK
ncbi:MAG: M48 family metallopeptidase [Novosphingobium sp.]|nr:M48 family metalloprotease [Novosphingobium sp.]